MKKSFLSLFFLLIITMVNAQTYSKEFGKIGKDELDLKTYSPDPDAEAVVLFDIGKSYFIRSDNSYEVAFERKTRIKILSQAGLEWAEVEIPFYQEGNIFEKVYEIEAVTYNFDGVAINRTILSQTNIYQEKVNDFWNKKKFALPNVKEGSIIEFRYKIISQYLFNLQDWQFQWKIPVIYSEYEVRMIPFYEYTFLFQGAQKMDLQTSKVDNGIPRQFGNVTFQDMVHTLVMKNIPAFRDESFITSVNDYITKIDFQLSKIIYPSGAEVKILTTWEDLIKNLLSNQNFGKYIDKAEKVASKLYVTKEISKMEDHQKIKAVIDYVKNNYKWNKINGKYTSIKPKELVDKTTGNSSDINLFAIGMLKNAGIDAYPVLISTRKNGLIHTDYPFESFFNYTLIMAETSEGKILTDATEQTLQYNRIPERCINNKGLLIKEGKVTWVDLEQDFDSETKTNINITLDNSLNLNADIEIYTTEYDANNYRNMFTEDLQEFKNEIKDKEYNFSESSVKIENQRDRKEPFILKYSLDMEPESLNDKIYISPFLNEIPDVNPLKQKERLYPVDMIYSRIKTYKSSIQIPERYSIDHLPESQEIENSLFDFDYSISTDKNLINIQFMYRFKKPVYKADDYSKIKFYFNEIVHKGNEKIVLKKQKTN